MKIILDIEDDVVADQSRFIPAINESAEMIKASRRIGWLPAFAYTSKVLGFSISVVSSEVEQCQQSANAAKSNETSS